MTGSAAALELKIFLEQTQYMPASLSAEAGARLVVHDPTGYPRVDEDGMNIKPNTAVSIAVQKVDRGSIHVLLSTFH